MQQAETLTTTEVIELLRDSVARHPGDADRALMLGSALYRAGHYAESIPAFRCLLDHHPDHPRALLLLARSVARCGRKAEAVQVLARAQQVSPGNTQVWQVAAALAAELRDWAELLRIARGWTVVYPGSHEAWQALSRAHFEESRFSEAIAAYQRVLELQPGNPYHLIGAARLAISAQDYEQARRHLDAAREIAPESADLLYTLGRLSHLTGELEAAEDYCRRAIAARAGFATAYVELGALCEGRLSDTEIDVIRQLFDDPAVHPEYRVMLGFTLGEALDRRNKCAEAFDAWDKGNEINRRISEQEGIVYQPALIESELQLLPAIFNDLDPRPAPRTSGHPRPIFVIGMPRSGTTLVETILASHSQVHGAGELPTLYDIHEELMDVARHQGVEAARQLVRNAAAGWRERYLAALPPAAGKSSIVDKQPLNFRSIGLIRQLFPDSPILYMRREPMDVGFSIYRHKFSKSWPCAHRLADIGHYYGIHALIFAHWQERHAESIHVVDYASLVQAPESRIRELLSHLDLEFEPACLAPHRTKRSVATFSAVQVRQPVSTTYSNRAARHAGRLAPLRDALDRGGILIPTRGTHIAKETGG